MNNTFATLNTLIAIDNAWGTLLDGFNFAPKIELCHTDELSNELLEIIKDFSAKHCVYLRKYAELCHNMHEYFDNVRNDYPMLSIDYSDYFKDFDIVYDKETGATVRYMTVVIADFSCGGLAKISIEPFNNSGTKRIEKALEDIIEHGKFRIHMLEDSLLNDEDFCGDFEIFHDEYFTYLKTENGKSIRIDENDFEITCDVFGFYFTTRINNETVRLVPCR